MLIVVLVLPGVTGLGACPAPLHLRPAEAADTRLFTAAHTQHEAAKLTPVHVGVSPADR